MNSTEVPGPLRPFTWPWAAAFAAAVNRSSAYREAAREWRWPLALVLEPAPDLGYPVATALVADLFEGTCRDARIHEGDGVDVPFVIRGPYASWKALIAAGADPVAAIVTGKLRLTGSLITIIRHVAASRALVVCARAVPTAFPDEPAGDHALP
jgi:putative sterol carrier protein